MCALTALAVNIFIFHLLGDVPSATLIGYVSDSIRCAGVSRAGDHDCAFVCHTVLWDAICACSGDRDPSTAPEAASEHLPKQHAIRRQVRRMISKFHTGLPAVILAAGVVFAHCGSRHRHAEYCRHFPPEWDRDPHDSQRTSRASASSFPPATKNATSARLSRACWPLIIPTTKSLRSMTVDRRTGPRMDERLRLQSGGARTTSKRDSRLRTCLPAGWAKPTPCGRPGASDRRLAALHGCRRAVQAGLPAAR